MLTAAPGEILRTGGAVDLAPDGRTAVTTWVVAEPLGSSRIVLVAVDTTTGERRTLAGEGFGIAEIEQFEFEGGRLFVKSDQRFPAVRGKRMGVQLQGHS